jgi:serine protease AprX
MIVGLRAPRGLNLLASMVLALAVAVVASAADAAPRSKPAVANVAAVPPKADRDGNKIFDDLEAKVASAVPGSRFEVLVALDVAATDARVGELQTRGGGFAVGRRFDLVDGLAATVTRGQLEALTHVPWVEHVEENARVHAFNDGAQQSTGVTKARADVPSLDGDADGDAAVFTGGDLVAAVIDTGIDASHLDLDEGKVLAFKDFVGGRAEPYDDNGHGTHVAATIASDGDARMDRAHAGVAPGAALVGVKVLDAAGGGSMDTVAAAIEWVVQNRALYGIEAINLSLGASGCTDGTDLASQAVDAAAAAGLAVFVAAGNDGPGKCTIGSPGSARGAITVGAIADTSAGGFSLAPFSSRGPTADGRVKPDLVAPGVAITSAQTGTAAGYVSYDGTSMATPFAAGVGLLALDANPALGVAGIRSVLTGTAVDWASTGADGESGAGRLDAYAALKAAGAALTSGPAVPAHVVREGTLPASGAYADFTVDVTSTSFPIAATLVHRDLAAAAAYSPDFDLYLYGPTGTLLARSETVDRQETVSLVPTTTGTYKLRVASYSGSGAYVVDAAGAFATAAPAPAPAPTPVPAPVTVTATPASIGLYAGSIASGDATRLAVDDNAFLGVRSTSSGTRASDWYGLVSNVSNALTSLRVKYRGRASATCSQSVHVYNWTSGSWTRFDARSVGSTEVEVGFQVGGTLANYVSGASGNGDVAVRVRCTRLDSLGFTSSADLLSITIERP